MLPIRLILDLHHVAAFPCDHAVLVAMRSRDLVYGRGQLAQSELVFVAPQISLQADAAAPNRDRGRGLGDSLVAPHLADGVLHVAMQVAETKAAQLVRIGVLGRAVHHRPYFLRRQGHLLLSVIEVAPHPCFLRFFLCCHG